MSAQGYQSGYPYALRQDPNGSGYIIPYRGERVNQKIWILGEFFNFCPSDHAIPQLKTRERFWNEQQQNRNYYQEEIFVSSSIPEFFFGTHESYNPICNMFLKKIFQTISNEKKCYNTCLQRGERNR